MFPGLVLGVDFVDLLQGPGLQFPWEPDPVLDAAEDDLDPQDDVVDADGADAEDVEVHGAAVARVVAIGVIS